MKDLKDLDGQDHSLKVLLLLLVVYLVVLLVQLVVAVFLVLLQELLVLLLVVLLQKRHLILLLEQMLFKERQLQLLIAKDSLVVLLKVLVVRLLSIIRKELLLLELDLNEKPLNLQILLLLPALVENKKLVTVPLKMVKQFIREQILRISRRLLPIGGKELVEQLPQVHIRQMMPNLPLRNLLLQEHQMLLAIKHLELNLNQQVDFYKYLYVRYLSYNHV